MTDTTRSILQFIAKAMALAASVVVPALIWYVVADPYRVVGSYDGFYPDPEKVEARVGINKGLVTIENFNGRRAEGVKYDGFIFGSSISCYYDADTWAALAAPGQTISPYHFDSSGETLTSLARKVDYLDREGINIRYALLVLDPIVMSGRDDDGPARIDPPAMNGSLCHRVLFHYTFFRAALNADFFKSWIPYCLTGQPYANGRNRVFEPQPIVYDRSTNQESIPLWDSLIAHNPHQFYSQYPLVKSPDRPTESHPVIDHQQVEALKGIENIFNRHHTDYQIIISPNRRKVTLNPTDYATLCAIFSPKRVHDFSRSMADDLECDTLLYDNTHYRAPFAEKLMRLVYR